MEVKDVSSNQRMVVEASNQQQNASAKTPNVSHNVATTPPPTSGPDVVELSSRSGQVVEKTGAISNAKEAVEVVEREKDVVKKEDVAKTEDGVRRDYNVENGKLVVKFVDTKNNEVVKEIPAEEARRITDAIARFREDGNQHEPAKTDNQPKPVDVTS